MRYVTMHHAICRQIQLQCNCGSPSYILLCFVAWWSSWQRSWNFHWKMRSLNKCTSSDSLPTKGQTAGQTKMLVWLSSLSHWQMNRCTVWFPVHSNSAVNFSATNEQTNRQAGFMIWMVMMLMVDVVVCSSTLVKINQLPIALPIYRQYNGPAVLRS